MVVISSDRVKVRIRTYMGREGGHPKSSLTGSINSRTSGHPRRGSSTASASKASRGRPRAKFRPAVRMEQNLYVPGGAKVKQRRLPLRRMQVVPGSRETEGGEGLSGARLWRRPLLLQQTIPPPHPLPVRRALLAPLIGRDLAFLKGPVPARQGSPDGLKCTLPPRP